MEYEGEFVRSHETGDEVSYKEHQQYQKRGTWQKGNYARSPASRSRSSNGPGSGWHGEPGRHAEAARMGPPEAALMGTKKGRRRKRKRRTLVAMTEEWNFDPWGSKTVGVKRKRRRRK